MMSLETKPQQYFVRFEISIKDVNDVALLALTDSSLATLRAAQIIVSMNNISLSFFYRRVGLAQARVEI